MVALGPKYILYRYMDPLGQRGGRERLGGNQAEPPRRRMTSNRTSINNTPNPQF